MPSTTRLALPYPEGPDIPDVPSDVQALAEAVAASAVAYGQGTLASRPVSTPGSPGVEGRVYYATDYKVLFWDHGTGWVLVGGVSSGTLAARPAASADAEGQLYQATDNGGLYRNGSSWTTIKPPLVSSLPGSPADGDEVYYVADATNGVVWHLRYRSAASGSYKWEYVGGGPLQHYIATAENTTSTSYANLTTVGPQVTVPLAGDYDVEFGAAIIPTQGLGAPGWGSPKQASMSYAKGATAAADTWSIGVLDPPEQGAGGGSGTIVQSQYGQRRETGLAAAAAIIAKYKLVQGSTAQFARRSLKVTPVRVG